MAVFSVSLAATGSSATIALPMGNANWNGMGGSGLSFLVNFSGQGGATGGGGTAAIATVTVQVSNDPNANPNQPTATQATARWNNHDTLVTLSADKNSSIVFPIAYARLYCTAYSSGTVVLMIGWMGTEPAK